MSSTAEAIKQQIDTLSPDDRADLALYLVSSLGPDVPGDQAAWEREVARRDAEIRSGTAVGEPASVRPPAGSLPVKPLVFHAAAAAELEEAGD
jgi:hypothetical protein